jgi:hypothetical protein
LIEVVPSRRRITAGDLRPLLGSSLITGAVTAVVVTVGTIIEDPRALTLDTVSTLLILTFIFSTVVVLTSALAIGLPTAWLFRRFGWERPWSYALVGFVAGASIWTFLSYRQETELLGRWMGLKFGDVMAGGLPGALCAGLWWVKTRQYPAGALDG